MVHRLIQVRLSSIMLGGDNLRMLIPQHIHNILHDLITLLMTSSIDTALLHRLTLGMVLLRLMPRDRIRARRLHIIRLLRRRRLVDARDIHRLVLE